MKRRDVVKAAGVMAVSGGVWAPVHAGWLSETDATAGIRAALERGAVAAVGLLGRPDGFLGNPTVRIPLPDFLQDVAQFLKAMGQRKRIEALEISMNRAAEAAVPEARAMLVSAVKSMSVEDARQLLTGGDNAATQFFANKTREPLGVKFLPIVQRATEKVSLAARYNAVASKAASFGLLKQENANLQAYVTEKALDGLYLMIGEEEKKIRADPVGTGSAILKKVFGSLK
jgi:hypothetical protein